MAASCQIVFTLPIQLFSRLRYPQTSRVHQPYLLADCCDKIYPPFADTAAFELQIQGKPPPHYSRSQKREIPRPFTTRKPHDHPRQKPMVRLGSACPRPNPARLERRAARVQLDTARCLARGVAHQRRPALAGKNHLYRQPRLRRRPAKRPALHHATHPARHHAAPARAAPL